MINVKVDVDEFNKKWNDYTHYYITSEIGEAVANEAIIPIFRAYPAQTNAPQPFKSDKSRRYFFARLKAGKIKVPYMRTQQLAEKWEVATKAYHGDSETNVRSKRRFARFVIGEKKEQSKYHAGNWPNVEDVARDVEAQQAVPIGERIVQEHLKKAGLT